MKLFASILAGVGVVLIALGVGGFFRDKTVYNVEKSAEIPAAYRYDKNGYTMGGRGGMMGGRFNGGPRYFDYDGDETNAISEEEAYTIGSEYVMENFGEGLTISENAYDMHGYYRFYLIEDDEVVGMVSVNGYTGDVWANNSCGGRWGETAAEA